MRIILAPDSFKGSLSAEDFCTVLAPLLQARAPMAQIIRLPLADGGEGTLRCLMRVLGGTIRFFQTTGALGDPLRAPVGFLPDHTAVMESAGVVGLPGVRGRENPEISSTWGLGVLMRKAVENGAKKILLTLGGTATNDLGLGMLAAMGYRFLNAAGEAFIPTGATMGSIVHVIRTRDFLPFESISFSVMCDVKNPLLGAGGAAAVFAPQKGADPAMVARLERQAQQAVKLLGSEEAMAEGGRRGRPGLCLPALSECHDAKRDRYGFVALPLRSAAGGLRADHYRGRLLRPAISDGKGFGNRDPPGGKYTGGGVCREGQTL